MLKLAVIFLFFCATVGQAQVSIGNAASRNFDVLGLLTCTNAAISRPHILVTCTNSQVNAGTTSSNLVQWSTIEDSYLMTTNGANSTTVVIPQSGTYVAHISTILRSGATEGGTASLWLRQNNTNIVRSGTEIKWPVVSGGGVITNVTQVIAVPIMFEATVNDSIELLWWSDNATIVSPYTGAGTNPPRPASPSTIMQIMKVSR